MAIRALWIRWLAVVALGAATASALSGQGPIRLEGVVQDADGRPLAGARVTLLLATGNGAEVEADSLGRFVLPDPPVAGGRIAARRVGFAPDTAPVFSVGGGPLLLVLGRLSPRLTPVVVTGRRDLRGPLAGFYARRAQGQGRFFTAEEIDREGIRRLSDLLRGLPGLQMQTRRGGTTTMRLRGANVAPVVWLDGAPLGGVELDIDAFDARTFAGVEVYAGPATVPAQFGGAGRSSTSGGTIVLWSREGQITVPRRRRGDPTPFARAAALVEAGEAFVEAQVESSARLVDPRGLAPLYPDSLLAAGVAGAAEVEFLLDAAGRVRQDTFGVVWATHPAFGEAVRRAVVAREWRPAVREGVAVSQLVPLTVLFDPQDAPVRP